MGLFIALTRRRELMKMKHQIEWRMTLITQAKGVAQNSVNNLLQSGTEYQADSLMAKRLQNRKYQLKIYEEQLDEQKAQLQTQLQEVEAELQSCNEMINKNLQSSFSYYNAA